jgi:glycosyltransferase involved in cell wall biosynthesis
MIQKLSVVIITFNEENNIGKCIDAASQVADEIVVVDSYSTDNTRSICESKGVRFVENEFEGHIQQKNFAVTLANYDNILSLDADEIISPTLAESILEVKKNWTRDAYYLNRRSYYCGKFINHGDWYPDRKIRLFKKKSGKWAGINPHDTFVLVSGKSLGKLKGNLEHYTFNSVAEHIEQAKKFSFIGSQELIKSEKKVHFYHLLFHPTWRFLRSYFIRFGFLDGLRGFTISSIIALETYLKYLQVYWPVIKHPFHQLSVMHVLSIKHWRGGEQQVAYLVDQLTKQGVYNYLVVARGSELAKYCKLNAIPHKTIVFGNGFNLLAAYKIKRLSQRLQVDIVHMHCSPSHTLAIFSNLLGNKAKLVLSRRVIFPVRPNTLSQKKFNFPAIESIICVSKAIQTVLEESINRKDIFNVVYDGVNLQSITKRRTETSIRDEFNLHDKTLVVIIAALSPEKDHATFIEAAKILANESEEFHFLIIGTGVEEKRVKQLIEAENLSDTITMTGFRYDIPDILQDSDYFVMTSRMEGLGSSIIEAFANKTPVVATRIGGIPELVIDGETGLLASAGNAEEIASHVLTLQNSPELKKRLIENATNLLDQKLRIEITAKQTEDIYKEIVFAER